MSGNGSSENNAAGSEGQPADNRIDDRKFMMLADKFIDFANQQNETVEATALHMVFLYAAARYNAHVAKNVLTVSKHEPFVADMMKVYQEMLRNHLADPNL